MSKANFKFLNQNLKLNSLCQNQQNQSPENLLCSREYFSEWKFIKNDKNKEEVENNLGHGNKQQHGDLLI